MKIVYGIPVIAMIVFARLFVMPNGDFYTATSIVLIMLCGIAMLFEPSNQSSKVDHPNDNE